MVLKPNRLVFVIYHPFLSPNARAMPIARVFMTQHALLPQNMLPTIGYDKEADEGAVLCELRATTWGLDVHRTMKASTQTQHTENTEMERQ